MSRNQNKKESQGVLHALRNCTVWRDILLTFAEMELDSTTMFPPGTGQM